ncbi:hypothetical protein NW767_011384 [Fusarium falciforme]|nr:hypothetical protein NW767_011384 [Fusarium falciforme]
MVDCQGLPRSHKTLTSPSFVQPTSPLYPSTRSFFFFFLSSLHLRTPQSSCWARPLSFFFHFPHSFPKTGSPRDILFVPLFSAPPSSTSSHRPLSDSVAGLLVATHSFFQSHRCSGITCAASSPPRLSPVFNFYSLLLLSARFAAGFIVGAQSPRDTDSKINAFYTLFCLDPDQGLARTRRLKHTKLSEIRDSSTTKSS